MQTLSKADLVYFVHKRCEPAWRLERAPHYAHGLTIVLEGEVDYAVGGRPHRVRAGEAVYVKAGEVREASTTGMTCAAFDFHLPAGDALDFPPVSAWTDRAAIESAVQAFEYAWLQREPGYAMECAARFALLVHALRYPKNAARTNVHAERMKRHLVEHFAEPVDVAALARLTGLSAVYCGALFRQTQGITLAEFTNRIRVRKAAALLADGDLAIAEVAEACGFNDVYYFNKVFKRHTGAPPGQYAARLRAAPAK